MRETSQLELSDDLSTKIAQVVAIDIYKYEYRNALGSIISFHHNLKLIIMFSANHKNTCHILHLLRFDFQFNLSIFNKQKCLE